MKFQSPYGDNALRSEDLQFDVICAGAEAFQSPYGDNALRSIRKILKLAKKNHVEFQSPYGDNALRRIRKICLLDVVPIIMFQSPYGDNALRSLIEEITLHKDFVRSFSPLTGIMLSEVGKSEIDNFPVLKERVSVPLRG